VVIEMDEDTGKTTGVFVGKCVGTTVIIKGKCKNVTLSNCDQCAIVFDTCIATCEVSCLLALLCVF
jgi:hypothetical protein